MFEISTERAAWILLAGFVALLAWTTWSAAFVLDEWEHVHAAWKMARGGAPYVDFFEHHHPPIYLLLAPLAAWWPESIDVILAARGLQLLVALGCVALASRIGDELEGPAVGRWAAGLWLGLVPVLVTVGKVRPDTPMVLCLFAAVLFGLRATGDARRVGRAAGKVGTGGPARSWAMAGASWSAALLLSSKALLFLPVMALFPFVVFVRARRGGGGDGGDGAGWLRSLSATLPARLWMTAGAAGPLLLGIGYLVGTGSLGAFWDWGVRFNLSFVTTPLPPPAEASTLLAIHSRSAQVALLLGNGVTLLLAAAGAVHVYRRGTTRSRVVLLGGTSVPLVVLWLVGRGLYWDLLPALLFPAILAGHGAVRSLERLGSLARRGPRPLAATVRVGVPAALLCAGLWAGPVVWLAGGDAASRELDQARFEYVRDRTDPGDEVHQEWPMFNLHRPDASFFWFGGPALVRRAAHLGLAEPYDLRALVSRRRPAFVSVLHRDEHHDWLVGEAGYRWIEDLGLYERRDGR